VASDAAEAARNDGVPHGHLKSSRGNSGSSGLVVTSDDQAAGRLECHGADHATVRRPGVERREARHLDADR
jgi:hypothetical protein